MFEARNLLREGRRQKNLPDLAVPAVCLLTNSVAIASNESFSG